MRRTPATDPAVCQGQQDGRGGCSGRAPGVMVDVSVRAAGRRGRAWALVAALVAPLALTAALAPAGTASADELTVGGDRLRTAWDRSEPELGPAAVGQSDFGQVFSTAVDGQVYAQPLVVQGVVVATTERNAVYGIDRGTGRVLWSRHLGAPFEASSIGCGDLVPDIGSTSTPVFDPATKAVYLTTKVDDGPDAEHPHWYVHALSVDDGTERPGWPVAISGAPTNDPGDPFDAFTAMQRPGLLLLGGRVVIGFASHCDQGPYVGYVASVSTSTRAVRLWSTESGSSTAEAGIWQSGGGLVSDGPGRVLLATGNGVSPAPGPGTRPPLQLAESVVRLAVAADGTMRPVDFFSPSDAPVLDQNDTDLGSGGPMALPDGAGTTAHPHLLVEVGKDGRLFLLDRDALGGRSQGPGGTDAVVSTAGPYNGVWGSPAFFGGSSGSYVYTVENNGFLRASKLVVSGSGVPQLSSAGTSAATFGYTSGSPVVTSSGTDPSTALVWVVASSGPTGESASLRAYDAVPVDGLLRLRYSVPIGTASKFTRVATDGGRVFLGTRDGQVLAFGRPQAAPLTTQPVDLGAVAVGDTVTGTATVTATRPVTVTGASTTAPFAVGSVTRTALSTGQSLAVPVSFTPTAAGPATATLQITTSAGGVGLDLQARGTRPGLYATPAALALGTVVVGASRSLSVELTNGGTSPLTVSGVRAPSAPWVVTGLPSRGQVVAPEASLAVSVTFRPTAAGAASDSLAVDTDQGTVTVPLTATAEAGAPHLTITPGALDLGDVQVGSTATRSFTVTNDGNTLLTITKAAAPAAPFTVADPLSEGLQLVPGQQVTQAVSFAPDRSGTVSGTYLITSDDGAGAHAVTLTGRGTPAPLPFDLQALQRNGATQTTGSGLDLTPGGASQVGSAVARTPLRTAGLHVRFTTSLQAGTGGGGLTLALLDAADPTSSPTSLGRGSGGLGFGGLHGVAVALDTHRDADGGDPSGSFVGLSTGTVTAAHHTLVYAATAASPTPLRDGPHLVDVQVTAAGHLVVAVDGTTTLDRATPVPASAYVGFTAANGTGTDHHTVSDVVLSRGATAPAPFDPASAVLAGSAGLTGSDVVLTPAQPDLAGSAFAPRLVATAGLHVRFTALLDAGTGADGLALDLLDRTAPLPALGAGGGGLGALGLPALVVALDSYGNAGEPASGLVGLSTGGASTEDPSALQYTATAVVGPSLRGTPHVVDVTVTRTGHVVVALDGQQLLDRAVHVPPSAYVGFSAGTGGLDDAHVVSDVVVSRP